MCEDSKRNSARIKGHLNLEPGIWHRLGHGDLMRAVARCILDGRRGPLNELRVLDVGCGRGELLDVLKRAGVGTACGVDADEECVRMASARAPCVLGRVEKLPTLFRDESFDVVVCVSVLEHLRDPLAAVWNMRRLTRGRLVLGVPNPYKTDCILRALLQRPRPFHYYHIYAWDAGHFKNFLERFCGLRVVRWGRTRVSIFPYGPLRFLPSSVLSTLHTILSPVENGLLPSTLPLFGCSLLAVCEKIRGWQAPPWILREAEQT